MKRRIYLCRKAAWERDDPEETFSIDSANSIANAPMFQPPPPPPPRVITYKTLRDNGAELFLGDRISEPQIAWDWIEETARVLEDLNVPTGSNPTKNQGQQQGRAPARTYAMKARAEENPDVIQGMFSLFDIVMYVLIDPGSMLPYICVPMPDKADVMKENLEQPILVSNLLGHSMRLDHVYQDCPLIVEGHQFSANLVELPYKEFDIILGMDWLTKYRAVIDCRQRTIQLKSGEGKSIEVKEKLTPKSTEFISYIHARRLIRMKCEAYLCNVRDTRKETPELKDIPTVCGFPDVFPDELPGIPSSREDECISVSNVIDKLPPSWKDYKRELKHNKDDLSLVQLGTHLRIEESVRARESNKSKDVAGPSRVNMVDDGGSKGKHKSGKRKKNKPDKNTVNKKQKVACWTCGKPGHFKKDCRVGKGKQEAGPSGSKDPNMQQGQNFENIDNSVQNYVSLISEAFYMQDDDVAWWVDSGATSHVCKAQRWFTSLRPIEDGLTLRMGNVSTKPIKGIGTARVDSYPWPHIEDRQLSIRPGVKDSKAFWLL
ncbi:unnamed protein product [Cuscuta campestris]|uniref:CCHC-type domain-containing protein n=1 Tax=Cuscuta campestris TaxID=132261 RepID=A0A484MQ67_9ASTE|nr:unnamed protein product [Cuscuta campestris]